MNYTDDISFSDILSKEWIEEMDYEIIQNTEQRFKKVMVECIKNALKVYPKQNDLFYIFNKCKLKDIKVVILGQDPYHRFENQANGMAFSVSNEISTPPSLKNIQKELLFCYPNSNCNNDLSHWVEQGVFLLNTSLSVTQNKPGSHINVWDEFIKHIIEIISKKGNIIFCLWGKNAEKMESYIDVSLNKNFILKCSHPSPLSAFKTENPFFGSQIFRKINEFLLTINKPEIKW